MMPRSYIVITVILLSFIVCGAAKSREPVDLKMMRLNGFRSGEYPFTSIRLDGFSPYMSPDYLAPDDLSGLRVRVDGFPVRLGLLGSHGLMRLPVAIPQIGDISVDTLISFESDISLQMPLNYPRQKLAWWGRLATGNESGDPGPFAWLSDDNRNVDKTGPDYANLVSWRGDRHLVEAAVIQRQHFATDEVLIDRVRTANNGTYPQLNGWGLNGRFYGRFGESHLWALAMHSDFDEFTYWAPLGREFPARTKLSYGGLRGRSWIRALRLDWTAAVSEQTLAQNPNALDLDADWRKQTLHISLKSRNEPRPARIGAHISLDGTRVEGYDPTVTDARLERDAGVLTVGSYYRHPLNRYSNIISELGLKTGDSGTAIDARLNWRRERTVLLQLSAGYLETLPEESGEWWYWYDRGLAPFNSNRPAILIDDDDMMQRALALQGMFRTPFPRGTVASGKIWLKHYLNYTGLQYTLVEDRLHTFVNSDESATLAGAYVEFKQQLSLEITHWLSGRWNTVFGNDRLNTLMGYTHRESMQYRIQWHPRASTFAFQPSIRWLSARSVVGMPITAPGQTVLVGELDEQWLLDVEVIKTMWDERIRIRFSLLNLLNEPEQSHPAGEITNLRAFVALELMLDNTLF